MLSAAWRPPWMATWASCGSWFPVAVRCRGQVADDEHLRVAGEGQVRAAPGRCRPCPCRRGSTTASGLAATPAVHTTVWAGSRCRPRSPPIGGHLGQLGVEADLDALVLQRPQGAAPGRRREPGQQVVGHLDQDHPRLGQVQVAEVARQVVADQLRQGPRHLDPGRAAPDQDDGERRGRRVAARGVRLLEGRSARGCGAVPRRGAS